MSEVVLPLSYQHGFGNEHETEALPGALPIGQFNPQTCAYGLYAEQFNTTAFTAPRAENRRTWLYRIRPSIVVGTCQPMDKGWLRTAPITEATCCPDPMRWDALPFPDSGTDFVDSLVTIAANGDAAMQSGLAVHVYAATASMQNRVFSCADGEWLIVPQEGGFYLYTELGILAVSPGEIAVVPRGMKFRVVLQEGPIRGYIAENYGAPLALPERGPVGANGYANERDFQYPVAWFEDVASPYELVTKFYGNLFRSELDHSPFDVVAWVGSSAPYKYDTKRFNVINTVSFDHPDPSIFTVLTSASDTAGVANLDFVIFPPRWMVAEHTFRPPWYHRNIMSEFMGLIEGVYDAKEKGFVPGGMSLHNCMTPHGPEAEVFEKASQATLSPQKYDKTLAFMFESRYVFVPTAFALAMPQRQLDYSACWSGLKRYFGRPKESEI